MNNDTPQSHEKKHNAPVIRKRVVIFSKEDAIVGLLVERLRQIGHDVILENVNDTTWYDHQVKEAHVVFYDPLSENATFVIASALKYDKPVLKIRTNADLVTAMTKEMDKLDLNKDYSKTGEFLGETPASEVFPAKKKDQISFEEVMAEQMTPLFDDKLNPPTDTNGTD